MQAFLNMGGYAAYVWPAYALAALGLGGVWYMYRRMVKTRQAELDRLRPPKTADVAAAEPHQELETREA